MKNILTLAAFAFALLLFCEAQVRSQQAAPNGANQGKFELHEFDYIGTTQTASVRTHGVFRIDTATGDTWIYLSGAGSDGKFVSAWGKIADPSR